MKSCILFFKTVAFVLSLFVSMSCYSQKAGDEIVRTIPLIKKNYYGRSHKNSVPKLNREKKTFSGEECFDRGIDEAMLNHNFAKALDWFIKGSSKADGPCELMCGIEYETGKAASQDYYKAVDYYKKAANKGIPLAPLYGIIQLLMTMSHTNVACSVHGIETKGKSPLILLSKA